MEHPNLKLSHPYECKDGLTRYVIHKIKLGRGYTIVWDTVPTSAEYWGDIDGMQTRQAQGLRGSIAQANFYKLLK